LNSLLSSFFFFFLTLCDLPVLFIFMQVLDNGLMVKIEKKYLLEISADLVGLVEPVSDLDIRLNLLSKYYNLRQLASLPTNAPLWVLIGAQDELAEAELKYIGPLSGGSSALYFGVELKGTAVGRGTCNGSNKGVRYFSCPDACGLFVPVSHIRLRHCNNDRSNQSHLRRISFNHNRPKVQLQTQDMLSRTAESTPIAVYNNPRGSSSPPPFHVGQRVCVTVDGIVHGGEVQFCGALPGRSSTHVGVLLDAPAGNWDGLYKEHRLCHIPCHLYGMLLPVSNVFAGASQEQTSPKPILKPALSPNPKQSPTSPAPAPRLPLVLPAKQALKPPLPPPKPTHKPLLTRPLPPPKPQNLTPVSASEHTNGSHSPFSPLRPTELEVGSMVEVNDPPLFGVIRWIGHLGAVKELVAGIELVSVASASVFFLFSCCSSADWVLFWPSDAETNQNSKLAQDLLRCEIVNPLRRNGYVCASKTMALRRLLEAANSNAGFTNQEKDPEEFLNKLFQLLRVEPLLKIRSVTQQAQECHLYQLFPPTLPASPAPPVNSPIPMASPASMRVASVQSLLESSFLHGGLKFAEAPSCLLLLMPRFGKDFKMFDAILPTLSLDITDLLDDTLRQCSICQAVAEWECVQCYEDLDITPGHLKQYCQTCNTQVHSHRNRASHNPVKIAVPQGTWSGPLHHTRQRMSLFAVTCIETSHYVSFVKHGPQASDWLFFDSMADREGGENGFNIPQVRGCPEVGRYLGLSEEELSRVDASSLRESARRLLCDSYMCLYHSPELSLYK
uniref:ubiquitinyl hydrolase 1 n=1 Tax=Xiphophorus couchianus TaxID=32473 RepID=A0A3B5LEA7_9TELE